MADKNWDDEVRRARARALKKMNRLKRERGVNIKGTKQDPTPSLESIKNMTAAQAQSAIARMESFIDRKVQYVSGSRGTPLTMALWIQYKKAEEQHSNAMKAIYDKYKDIKMPNGIPLSEYIAMTRPKHNAMTNPASNNILVPTERKSTNVVNDDKLEKLIISMQEKNTPDYIDKKLAEAKEQFEQMMAVVKDESISSGVASLTDEQFMVMWEATQFAASISLPYELAQQALQEKGKTFHESVDRDSRNDALEFIKWAQNSIK